MHRNYFLPSFIIAGIIILLLLVLSRTAVGDSVSGAFRFLFSPFQIRLFQSTRGNDQSPLQKLQQDNSVLQSQLIQQQELKNENQALHDQFATATIPATQLIPSTIVGMPGYVPAVSAPILLVIDKGQKDGVEKGNAVIVGTNFIGIIDIVTDHFSQVILVTKKGTSLTAKDISTNTIGVIRGEGNTLLFDNVLLSDTLKVGDSIVTGGTMRIDGSGYPEGLVIGKITAVDRDPSALFQKASVTSLVRVEKLTVVFVMKNQ